MKSHALLTAAALLLAFGSPVHAQSADGPPSEAARAGSRLTLSLAVDRPGLVAPEYLADEYRGTTGAHAAAHYAFGGGLEAGLAYGYGAFEPRDGAGASSAVHSLSVTGAVLASEELPVRPYVEMGPSLVVFTDEGAAPGAGRSSRVAGALLGAGVRFPFAGRLGGRAGASLLVADGPENDPLRVFTGLHLGATLAL